MTGSGSERVAREVVCHGLVQGVGFRFACREQARAAGVDGWVTNAADGTVRARVEGSSRAVAAMLDWLRSGPPHADVEHLDVDDVAPDGRPGFRVR